MRRQVNGGLVSADDVFRHASAWFEITREEAFGARSNELVVVVHRHGSAEYADWFDRDHAFSLGVGPHAPDEARYYRYRPPTRHAAVVTEGSGATAPPIQQPAPPPPRKPASSPPEQKTWIEIELIDDDGQPVIHEPYTILLTDGSKRSGSTDHRGRARFAGIDPGTCEVSFPSIDARELKVAG